LHIDGACCQKEVGMFERMPTIYIDCSATYTSLDNTGIQRVVRNVALNAVQVAARLAYKVKFVAFREGAFSEISLSQFQSPNISSALRQRATRNARIKLLSWVERMRNRLAALSDAPAWKAFINAPRYRFGLAQCIASPVSLTMALVSLLRKKGAGERPLPLWLSTDDLSKDILLLADSTFDFTEIWPAVSKFRQQGGYVSMVVYDLIPLSHPQFCPSSFVNAFTNWITKSIPCADFYICISRSTETALRAFLERAQSKARTGYFHLGSDLDVTQMKDDPAARVVEIFAGSVPVFLAVGSLEPRKNLSFVLDAFERIWRQDSRVKLVLVGHNTWKVEELLERIRRHPLLNTSLFWIRDASDTDLEYLYQNASALIFASMVEGFGLPIVEAMQRGLPVLCSDLPVFREIADGKARFFSLETIDELTQSILDEMEQYGKLKQPRRAPSQWLSWNESTTILLNKVHGQFLLDRKLRSAMAHA
jgi:glycosyltransferase involved in cell wall biosynthesis